QRLLRPDHGQPDPFLLGELDQAPEVARLDGDVLHVEGGAGVTRGAEDRRDPRRLLQLPAKGVFPPPFSHHKDFQGTDPHSRFDPPPSTRPLSYSMPWRPCDGSWRANSTFRAGILGARSMR